MFSMRCKNFCALTTIYSLKSISRSGGFAKKIATRNASLPNLSTRVFGFNPLNFDLDIF
jgi:hypothetical protein